MSSVSSDLDDENELQSMTGKGINHLCSELLELKAESDEDFHRNIFSNYSSFVRIFDEVKAMENELTQLKGHVLTQKKLVKDLMNGIYLKVLSEEIIDSILQESEFAEPAPPIELAAHIDSISETLDVLMFENRIDEAIAILQREDENLQRMQFEDNSPEDLLMLYNSAVYEKKAMLTLQQTLSAENPRISAAELQKVLIGICRLGDTHLATQLLLKYYHSRLATGRHNLQCSQSFLDGFQWAREETELVIDSFNKYVKSSSDVTEGFSKAVEAMQFSLSYCSLLKSQRYLISGILSEGNYVVAGQHPEYCLLTNSGRKFITLLQAIIADVTPFLAIRMEGSILNGLMNLFTEYIAILEEAITFETHVSEKRSFLRGPGYLHSELRKKNSIDFLQEELDGCILFIQEAAAKLKARFCQQFINRMSSPETSSKLMLQIFNDSPQSSKFQFAMPSVAFQVLFFELRKVDKIDEDNVFEEDWLMELLRDLIEAIFSWMVNNKEIWRNKENSPVQLSDIISQSETTFLAPLPGDTKIWLIYLTNLQDFDGDGWVRNAANEAMQKLLEIETMQLIFKDDSADGLEEEPCENKANDLVPDKSLFPTEDSVSLNDADEFSAVMLEAVDTANDISETCDELYLQEKTDFPDPSSTDGTEDGGNETDAIDSNVDELESASKLSVPVMEDADVTDSAIKEVDESCQGLNLLT
ncbi:Phospholipid sterol acyl transferase 1 isoform 1 [Hibiscus syriacus]|uniref:Phospholipid sterol acyl transferase 1 isoform 1 n=1 Tax=Hibiscus syriacus TaxID=106335 RepID=A0A6A2YQW2_HIBSY|nr:Phospholipid sterol acyl transferase 1 isoform 1 [Hibiscus syriacus]